MTCAPSLSWQTHSSKHGDDNGNGYAGKQPGTTHLNRFLTDHGLAAHVPRATVRPNRFAPSVAELVKNITINLRTATFNFRSFNDPENVWKQREKNATRGAVIRQQLKHLGIHLAGMQGTRLPQIFVPANGLWMISIGRALQPQIRLLPIGQSEPVLCRR